MIKNFKQKIYNFLRWTQKYTKTDMVYLAKEGSWLTLGKIISIVASFLSAIAFANLLNPITYGNYKYILSLVGILGIFSLNGMRTAITQAVARGLEGSFYKGFEVKLKWGLLGSLMAIGGGIYYYIQGNYFLSIPLFVSAIFLPLMYASTVYGDFLTGKKLFNIQIKYGAFNTIIPIAIVIATLFFTKNLIWIITIYFVSHTLTNYFFYLLTKFKFRPNKKRDPQTLSYGKHLSLIGVLGVITNHLDKILLFTFIGSVELAIYSFAILAPEQIRGVLKNIHVLALPKLATRSQEEIKANIIKKIAKLFILIGIIITAYIIIAPYIYKIFFPQYLASIPYSQIFVFSLISFPLSLIGTIFKAKMMKKEIYLLKIVNLVRLILLVILVPIYGILGAILTILGTEIFACILTLFLFRFSLRNQNIN